MTKRLNTPTITLRPPQPGDMGWVVQQHGEFYWREYGWDARFEALVLKIVSGIVQKWQPAHEKCWIAEVDGVRAIYLKRGFRLTKSESYEGFGHDLVGETWELKL